MTQTPGSDRILQRLLALHPKVIDLSLDRIERLLAALDHPERRLAPVIHLAGTNGKGSTLAFLRAMLEAAGKRVQVYSSPHLLRFHERIRLSQGLISEDALQALLEEAEAANGNQAITFFEITTAAAFLAFSREAADVLLLETGLGGRLDATNVIRHPLASVITPISLDHMQYLGNDIAAIAGEKAGIIKKGVPVFSGPQSEAAAAVLRRRAEALAAPLAMAGEDWRVTSSDSTGFQIKFGSETISFPRPGLLGRHQVENAALAIAVARGLGRHAPDLAPSPAAIASGVARATWPARLQRLRQGPLIKALPADWELWLDGGHNAAAGEAIAGQLDDWAATEPERPTHIVFGMLNTKAAEDFLRPLLPRAASFQAVTIEGETASLSAEEAAARAAGAPNCLAAESPQAALQAIAASAPSSRPGRVLICGSLYLAGNILRDAE